ncbi:unnamed protein product [Meloidogyne enterolobii]|uniref:Uncharacterized protein n=1 Tax=Meloidogyne enterolobii TaxID=390850 RepID=A0ACB1ANW6_MELEN
MKFFNNKILSSATMALIVFLLLFPLKVNAKEKVKESKSKIVGLAEHKLDEDNKVILAEGSNVVKTSGDVKHYNDRGCDVAKEDKDIIIHYDGSVKDGCTVDLLTNTNKKSGIKFKVGMNYDGECLTDSAADNLIPFVYGLTNEEIEKHRSGPIISKKECKGCGDKNKCITRTGLEVGWEGTNESISFVAKPIGELQNTLLPLKHEENGEHFEIEMEIKEPKKVPKISLKNVLEEGAKKINLNNAFSCLENKEKSIVSLNIWEIEEDTSPDPEKKNLFVFHLLPLPASLLNDNGHEAGCSLYIKFSVKDFALLTIEGGEEGSTSTSSSSSSKIFWIIIAVTVFIVCLLSVLASVLIYFICRKKSSKLKEEDKKASPYSLAKKPSDPKLKEPAKPKPKRKVKTEDKYETITTKISLPAVNTKKRGPKPGIKPKTDVKPGTKEGKLKTIGPTQRSMEVSKMTQMGNGEDSVQDNVQ